MSDLKMRFNETIAEELLGASGMVSVSRVVEDIIEDYAEFSIFTEEDIDWGIIENITFECTSCGWWCEAGDYGYSESGENICSACTEAEECDICGDEHPTSELNDDHICYSCESREE